MKKVAILSTLFASLTLPHAAFAHAMLLNATPSAGASVSAATTELVMHFSEGVEPTFTTVAVTNAAGERVDNGAPTTETGDQKVLHVGLKKLAPGGYTVEWHATSVDTHKTNGHFAFTVTP